MPSVFFCARPEGIEKDNMFVYIQNCADEKKFSVRVMCVALPVSESSFYKWKVNKGKPKAWQKLLAQMHKILEEDEENKNYGVRRMQIALEQWGIKRSLSTIRRAMVRRNLLHEDRRTPDGLTKAEKKALRPQNIIKQDFSAQESLRKLLTDITLTPVQGRKAIRVTAFGLLQWRDHFSCNGHKHEKGTMYKNDNGGIQEF